VRRRSSDQLDVPFLHEGAKGTQQVAIHSVHQIESSMVQAFPIARQGCQIVLAPVAKMLVRVSTGTQAGIKKKLELLLQKWTRELFTQDRREAYRDLR
jgi:hypothetical protein